MAFPADFRVESRVLLVPVTVTDPHGALVNGLGEEAFTVVEEQQAQPIVSFFEMEVACSIGVVLDLSASMAPHLTSSKRALRHLLDRAETGDEALLVGFNDHAVLRNALTEDLHALLADVSPTRATGDTALYDAVALGIEQIKEAGNHRRALVVISDGVDNNSRHSRAELLRLAAEAGVEIHSLALADVAPGKRSTVERHERQNGLAVLSDLAKASGGISQIGRVEPGVEAAVARLARALHNQYVIGYRPVGEHDGKHHTVQIRVAVPGAQVHWRRGYLSD